MKAQDLFHQPPTIAEATDEIRVRYGLTPKTPHGERLQAQLYTRDKTAQTIPLKPNATARISE